MINFFLFLKQNLKFGEKLKLCQNTIQNIIRIITIRMTLSLKVQQ